MPKQTGFWSQTFSSKQPARSDRTGGGSFVGSCFAVLLLMLLVTGCGSQELSTEYGKRSGNSVNGTGVLSNLLVQAGHKVYSSPYLSPRVQEVDTIVWFANPHGFTPISAEFQEWIEDWLSYSDTRTFIYVGGDYQAEYDYWETIIPQTPATQQHEAILRKANTRRHPKPWVSLTTQNPAIPNTDGQAWFGVDVNPPEERVKSIRGPWATSDIQQSDLGISLSARYIDLRPGAEILLESAAGDLIAFRQRVPSWRWQWDNADLIEYQEWVEEDETILSEAEESELPTEDETVEDLEITDESSRANDSETDSNTDGKDSEGSETDSEVSEDDSPAVAGQIIVVTNGSFLLNYSLVNHEHRKLAGHLIDELGPSGKVIFLETYFGEPAILNEDPESEGNSLLKLFGAWPMNFILVHFAILGIIFCFVRAPIFGRPRDPAFATQSDFGKHINALGEQLSRTANLGFAIHKIQIYQQQTRGERERATSNIRNTSGQPEISEATVSNLSTDAVTAKATPSNSVEQGSALNTEPPPKSAE